MDPVMNDSYVDKLYFLEENFQKERKKDKFTFTGGTLYSSTTQGIFPEIAIRGKATLLMSIL